MKTYIGTKTIKAEPAQGFNEVEGYAVVYNDGHESWSPKKAFEEAYRPLDRMTFGHAVELLKAGHKVARAGWNGKNMWLYYVPANSYAAQTRAARSFFGESVPYRAYIAMVTVDRDVVPWVASQTDVLAEDWTIVE